MTLYKEVIIDVWSVTYLSRPLKVRVINSFCIPLLIYCFRVIPCRKLFRLMSKLGNCWQYYATIISMVLWRGFIWHNIMVDFACLMWTTYNRRLMAIAYYLCLSTDVFVQLCWELDEFLLPCQSIISQAVEYCYLLTVSFDYISCDLCVLCFVGNCCIP